MSLIQGLAFGLSLLTPFTSAIATMEQAVVGKIQGFTGPAGLNLSSDYLVSTFCYCSQPAAVAEQQGEAHYYQIDYYNMHLNTTFIVSNTCDEDTGTGCMPSTMYDGVLAGDSIGDVCKSWMRYHSTGRGKHDRHLSDKLCYLPNHQDGEDFLQFNKQSRNLGAGGGQGQRFQDKGEAERVCEIMCNEQLGLPILQDEDLTLSHQVLYEHMDDMCDGCQ